MSFDWPASPLEAEIAASSGAERPGPPGAPGYTRKSTSPGTTGFDVVGSWGWLRVEVPGGLVKHPGTNKCEVTS
jgi:hypothetical protein